MPNRTQTDTRFRFSDANSYAQQLESCGSCLRRALTLRSTASGSPVLWELSEGGTELWTDFVLDWFADTAPTSVLVDAHASPQLGWLDFLAAKGVTDALGDLAEIPDRPSRSEFLVDLLHTTHPRYANHPFYSREYWDAALRMPFRGLLAVESEFGKQGAVALTRSMILEDAAKLAIVRADAKVMLFGTTRGGPQTKDLLRDLRLLRKQAQDASPWLFVDVPWDRTKSGDWEVDVGLL
jgi:hypothetical protein